MVGSGGFGECINCGSAVERVGWDDLCFRCQDEEADDLHDTRDDYPEVYADEEAKGA